MPDITEAVAPPRLVGVGFPTGRPFGAPNDSATQSRVLRAALATLGTMSEPGRVDLDIPYPGPRARVHPPEPPPIARLLKRKPWLLPKLISGNIPD